MEPVDAERLLRDLQPGRARYAATEATLVDDLQARNNEASTWCALRCADEPQVDLRPQELAPAPLETNRWHAVHDVGALRRALRPADAAPNGSFAGRFLVYFPDADLCDGAAEVESKGFFDTHNCPPFGTWVGYFEDGDNDPSYSAYLLTWIPEPFLALADAGVVVNPEQCIRWLDQTDVRIKSVLPGLTLPTIVAS